MQIYLVILGFIRPLLVMVVEDSGQNRVHLGEALVFEGSWGGRQGGGEWGRGWGARSLPELGPCLSLSVDGGWPSTLQYIRRCSQSCWPVSSLPSPKGPHATLP